MKLSVAFLLFAAGAVGVRGKNHVTLSRCICLVLLLLAGASCPISAQSTDLTFSDFDGSGRVDFSDFLEFAAAFGKSTGQDGFDDKFDLDGSSSVDFGDFLIFASNFGKSTTETSSSYLYVSDLVQNRVEVVDTATNLTIPSRAFSVSLPRGMTIGARSRLVYVATLDSLLAFDEQGQMSFGIPLTPFENPSIGTRSAPGGFKVRVNRQETLAFVTETSPGAVEIFDLVNRVSTGLVTVGFNPGGMILTPDETELYVGLNEDYLAIIDIASLSVDSIAVGTSTLNKLALSVDGSTIYTTTATQDEWHQSGALLQVIAIDRVSRSVVDSVQISNPEDLTGQVIELSVNPLGNSLYVSYFRTSPGEVGGLSVFTFVGDLLVVTLPSLAVADKIAIGESVGGFGISPDGTTAYVSGSEELASGLFRVYVVDLATRQRLSQLPIAIQSATEFIFQSTKRAVSEAIAFIDLAFGYL